MKHSRGFTLIELMLVVAVLAIIFSIAYPTFLDHIRKSRRSDAKAALMDAATKMERHYTQFGRYSAILASSGILGASPEGLYAITATITGANSQTFTLTATPQAGNDQANDKCGNFVINEAQQKTVSGSLTADECW